MNSLSWTRCTAFVTLALATIALAQEQLPRPDPAFPGKIAESYKDSTPSYPLPVKAPPGAPNVLLILLDDVGFGMCSTFGGSVPTPQLDTLAKGGLRYNRAGCVVRGSITAPARPTGRGRGPGTTLKVKLRPKRGSTWSLLL